ncbi:hypothetical protein GGI07_005641 [Coemansia sp. Benny D115]|nr:hypothetical protein GGI07_005641 [Coemansia sp. Benny D115]
MAVFHKIGAVLLCVLAALIEGDGSAPVANNQTTAACPGYRVGRFSQRKSGFEATLSLDGLPCNVYGNDILSLDLSVRFDTRNRLHVHIQDSDGEQFQIPQSVLPLDMGDGVSENDSNLRFDYTQDPQTGFGFRVLRDNEVIFDTTGHPLIFEDQYIEITSSLVPNANIYGIGESPDYFRRNTTDTIKTLWNRGAPNLFRENVYGSHSIYMELREGIFHGAYLHNSHGMDIVLANNTIQYRVLGGTADFYFFEGPSALDVIDQYTSLVGRPNRIPYWSLGFHNCRFGYKSVYEVNQVIANYSHAKIPLEVAWTDIDYMDHYRDFTFDPKDFPLSEMKKQLETLHQNNQRMVLIIDPAIVYNASDAVYARGHKQDVFIKNTDGSEFVGQVWPGYTVFPDWFAKNTDEWWHGELTRYLDQLAIDGMWIDMNEAASFCTGSCGSGRQADMVPPELPWTLSEPLLDRELNTSDLFLVPRYSIRNLEVELSVKTIETTARHANGVADYHVHNLYGHMESKTTRDFLLSYRPNTRPFVLSRSTFAGSGALVNHWTGDNAATWEDMHLSIPSMFDFGIFGIPMVGADICGFFGNTTEELCARWVELGAFYPFSRSHNTRYTIPQEPYRWATVATAARRALNVRYSLLPYFYTMYQHSVERGWPVARPLVFAFPQTAQVADNDRQLLIGDGILVSPVLEQGATTVRAFFPRGKWYDWYTLKAIDGQDDEVTLNAELEHINVNIRGGRIIPVQVPAMTTAETLAGDYHIIVATSTNDGPAFGELYQDDGVSLSESHSWVQFEYSNRTLHITPNAVGGYSIEQKLSKLSLLGVSNVDMVLLNGFALKGDITEVNGNVVISGLGIDLNSKATITFQ